MTTQSREESAFENHYSELYGLTDVDNLLPHFVEENIISESNLDETKSFPSGAKMNMLLLQISDRLKTGNTKSFYAMLFIMKKHGSETTRNLSNAIMSTLKTDHHEYSDDKESSSEKDTMPEQEVDHSPVLTPDPLSVHFSNFVASIEECLEKCPNKLDACKRICSNLTISGSDSLLFNNQQLTEIDQCASFRQLFTLLRQHWNWKEYSILKKIIEISESDEAKTYLEKYQKRATFTRSFSEAESEPAITQTSVDDEEEVALQNEVAGRSHRRSIKIEDKRCENCVEEDPVVAYCPDCHLALCSVCTTSHKRDKRFHDHSILTLAELRSKKAATSKDMGWFCKEHDYELKHYCETCEQLVCLYCTTKEHNGHNHDTIKMIAGKHRNQIKEAITPVEKMIKDLTEACNKVNKTGFDIEKQGKQVDMEIDKHYHELIEKLKAQKEEIKQQARDIISQKGKAINAQLKQMKQVQADLEGMKEIRDCLKDRSDQETLSTKKRVIDRMQQLTIQYKKLNTSPVESPSVTFLPAKRPLPKFGQVFAFVDPEASEVKLPRFTFKRTKVEFNIITKYSNGSQYPHGGNRVSVELERSTGEAATVHVTDNNDGSYTASFVAQQLGSLELSISINGTHIKGSPYSVTVGRNYPAIDKPSRIIDNNGKMGVPWGIAFGNHGIWAVADYHNHCIYIFDAQDRLIKKFGSKGTNTGQFQSPGGVALDKDNHIYVADHYNNRVQKFDINGNYLLQFGNQRSSEGQLNCPVGVAVHKDKLYVTEEHSDHISVFQMNGQLCNTIGQGHLSGSFDVAINVNDQLLVADCSHNCVFIFGLGGHYVGKIGHRGTGRGQLSNPRGLITDPNGFVFVAEFGNHRISIFDQSGNFMHCFGSRGSLEGQFQSPLGIALSSSGSIYVSDGYGKRIQIFSTF